MPPFFLSPVLSLAKVRIATNAYSKKKQYEGTWDIRLSVATSYGPHLAAATRLVEQQFKEGYSYHKVSVRVRRLGTQGEQQLPLLAAVPAMEREHETMVAMDTINRTMGNGTAGGRLGFGKVLGDAARSPLT